ncbi:MAG: hypothetical protein MN733_05025 [Nitrososphaera sp.]|nr:hypothetical protein [Nitrososphaera sp.]
MESPTMTYVLSFALMFLALVAWRKKWHITGLLIALLGFVCAFSTQEWVQNLIKHQLEVVQKRQQLYYAKQIDGLQQGLGDLAKKVADQQTSLEAQQELLVAQQAAIKAQQEAWNAMNEELLDARQRITKYQEQLGNVGSLARDILSGQKTESFQSGKTDRLIIIPDKKRKEALVYFQLWEVPRPETIQLQSNEKMFSADSYRLHKNILLLKITSNVKKLNKQSFSITYVPDSSKSVQYDTMTVQDGTVYANEQRLSEVFADLL